MSKYAVELPPKLIARIQYDKLLELKAAVRKQMANPLERNWLLKGFTNEQLTMVLDFIDSFPPIVNSTQMSLSSADKQNEYDQHVWSY